MVKAKDLCPASLGSTPAGRASSQNCSRVPVKVLPILVGMSEPLNKGVNNIKFGPITLGIFLPEILKSNIA